MIEVRLQKLVLECRGGSWWEFLPDVVKGLYLLLVCAKGFAPYMLLFKQLPHLPILAVLCAMTDNEVGDWGPEHMEELVGLWEDLLQEVKKCQGDYNAAMVRNYLKQKYLSQHNIRFLFETREPVLVQARIAGKLSVWSEGPFQFVQYVGPA